jgi:hypothetical protein
MPSPSGCKIEVLFYPVDGGSRLFRNVHILLVCPISHYVFSWPSIRIWIGRIYYYYFFNSHSGKWNWVHSARRPLNGLLYLPRVIVMKENLVEWRVAGETAVLGENLPQRNFVHHKTDLPHPGSNPGRRGGKPATNRLSYSAVLIGRRPSIYFRRFVVRLRGYQLLQVSVTDLTLSSAFMPSTCNVGYYSLVVRLYCHYMFQPNRPPSGVQVVVITESAAHCKAVFFRLCSCLGLRLVMWVNQLLYLDVLELRVFALSVRYIHVCIFKPVTVVERSKACTVFARSEAVIVGSKPTHGTDVWYVCLFCVCVVLGRGLATSWSLVKEVLPSVKWSKWKNNLDTVKV